VALEVLITVFAIELRAQVDVPLPA
ncbi:uncharacterized protein METZ01_LOCUS142081, partial [marine metagenome]